MNTQYLKTYDAKSYNTLDDLYKTWNDKQEFENVMNQLNKKVLEKDILEKTTQFKSFFTANSPGQTHLPSYSLVGNSVYDKFQKEKNQLKENLLSSSKNDIRNFKQNLQNRGIDSIIEGTKVSFDDCSKEKIKEISLNNNLYNESNFNHDKRKLVNSNSKDCLTTVDLENNNTNKATFSKNKNINLMKSNTDIDNTSIISSIHFRSASKEKKKEGKSKTPEREKSNFYSQANLVKPKESEIRLMNMNLNKTSVENNNNLKIASPNIKPYFSTEKNINLNYNNNFNNYNNYNNYSKNIRLQNKHDFNEENEINEITQILNNNRIANNHHRFEKAYVNQFSKKLSIIDNEKKPNSSLFKKYVDTHANTKYYFPLKQEENRGLFNLKDDFLPASSVEMQWKERSNRNFFYEK